MKSQTVKAKMTSKATPVAAKRKPVAKSVAKPTPKPKPKPKSKTAAAGKAVKPAAKKALPVKKVLPTKKVATVKKTPVKTSAGRTVAKTKAKTTPKVAVAKAIKTTKVVKAKPSKVLPPKTKVKPKESVKKTSTKNAQVEVKKPKQKPVSPVPPVKLLAAGLPEKSPLAVPISNPATAMPVRAGRPSSRLAQLTVPSMAQSVASTAAKASFSQTISAPPIVPPLASAVKKNPKLANNWKLKPVEQLTDAEVIAMSDDEYMNDTQMKFFRLKLLSLKYDILSNAGETTEHLRADTVVVPDPADRATIEEEHALELRTRDRERKLLKKIEQSIIRIDAGDYGYCDETGEPIGVARLIARPTANLSLEAQQRRELKQKMFGD